MFKILTPIKTKILNKWFLNLGLILILTMVVNLLHFSNIKVEAAQVNFNGGIVSLNKYYVDGLNEVETLTVAPGDYITVRLRYSNTSPISATNGVISDSLPDSKFTFIPGTLKNCLVNSNTCATLNDGLFTGSNLVLNPSSGYYGSSTSSASGNLELGKNLYLHNTVCSQSAKSESFIQSVDNSTLFVPNCSQLNGGSFVTSSNNFSLLGQRYLHQTVCNQTGGDKENFVQAVNNSATFTPDCSNLVGATVSDSSTTDLYFAANGNGYIEYQMQSNIVEDFASNDNINLGNYGTNTSLASSDFITIVDNMENTLAIKIFCDTISPLGGTRNINLSDAELRAGQDFRCNYQASICPVVFDDLNSNGVYDITDIRTAGIDVLLQNAAGSETLATLTTTTNPVCFNNLSHGRNYRIAIIAPPSGSSTTGGNIQTQLINYLTNSVDVFFGYANGALILNVPPFIALPTLKIASVDAFTTADISPIQVIDTRLSNPGWTLTATISDFVARDQNAFSIPVSNKFRNLPGSIVSNSGQTGGLAVGDQKTITSTIDPMSIFRGNSGASLGDFQISTNIRLTVPAFSRSANYETQYVYTII